MSRHGEGGRARQNGDHVACPGGSVSCVRAREQGAKDDKPGHRDDIVERWSPREGAKDLASVQDFAQEAIERVKQDLGKTPIGKSDGKGHLVWAKAPGSAATLLRIERY